MSGFANDNYLAEFATSNPSQPSPVTNVAENEEAYSLEIGLPGFSKEEIQVNLADFQLIVTGQRSETKDNVDGLVQETESKTFRKAFFVADHIDKENISAKFENGLLIINLPKKYELKSQTSIIEID